MESVAVWHGQKWAELGKALEGSGPLKDPCGLEPPPSEKSRDPSLEVPEEASGPERLPGAGLGCQDLVANSKLPWTERASAVPPNPM